MRQTYLDTRLNLLFKLLTFYALWPQIFVNDIIKLLTSATTLPSFVNIEQSTGKQ